MLINSWVLSWLRVNARDGFYYFFLLVIIDQFFDNVSHFLFGYGPNGFRMLSVNKVSQMSYGHNVYFHTVGAAGEFGCSGQ